jgi:hypothetical protein
LVSNTVLPAPLGAHTTERVGKGPTILYTDWFVSNSFNLIGCIFGISSVIRSIFYVRNILKNLDIINGKQ